MATIWSLSDSGTADPDRNSDRWTLTWPKEDRSDWSLKQGTLIDDWKEVILTADEDGPIEDMPWVGSVHVVSTRLREFFEHLLPDHGQYLPVHIRHKGKAMKIRQYWAVNWLHLIDCLDHNESDYQTRYYDGIKHLSINKLVVHVPSVPDHIKVWRIKDAPSRCVGRDEVKRALYATEFTGFQFYDIHESHM